MTRDSLEIKPEVLERAKKITLLMMDVDGVLTDGRILYGNYGDELQSFNVKDGMGMWLWHEAGMQSVVLSGRRSAMVTRRSKEMQVSRVHQAVKDKKKTYLSIIKEMGKLEEEVCYMGDDLLDIPVLQRAGLAVTVADAVAEVRSQAHYITQHSGGSGAVREVVDLLLKATGQWEKVTQLFRV